MDKRILYAIIVFLFVFSCYTFYSHMSLKALYVDAMLTKDAAPQSIPEVTDARKAIVNAEQAHVTFYICGEVNKPDIYTLPEGSRIVEAIEAAGGKTVNAALEMMESVAGKITDGQKIYVPNINDDIDKINYMNNNSSGGKNASASIAAEKNPAIVVNINTAGIEELCQIPGIGEATARLIYDYRLENGDFLLIEDIKNVPRIGDKTFESIKKNIKVE